MLYVFHGEDEFSRAEAIAELRGKMDPVVGELNTAVFDGRGLSPSELQAACDAVPFMAGCRLVIVNDLVSPAGGGRGSRHEAGPAGRTGPRRQRTDAPAEAGLRGFEGYLSHLPASVWLVLNESRGLPGEHPLLQLARGCGACVRGFSPPGGSDLKHWIELRARARGVAIAPSAADLLATYIGPNLRLLDQELEKLATYLGGSGTIGRREVEALVSSLQEANIFHMVDALGNRDGRRALVLLHRLLAEKNAALYLLTMIVRQFRLLLQARELDRQGVPPADMCHAMEVSPKIVGKCLQQARNFSSSELKAILAQLLDIDTGIKTGRLDGLVALDLFVIRWAGR